MYATSSLVTLYYRLTISYLKTSAELSPHFPSQGKRWPLTEQQLNFSSIYFSRCSCDLHSLHTKAQLSYSTIKSTVFKVETSSGIRLLLYSKMRPMRREESWNSSLDGKIIKSFSSPMLASSPGDSASYYTHLRGDWKRMSRFHFCFSKLHMGKKFILD